MVHVDARCEELGGAAEHLALLGVLQQREYAVSDQVHGGLVTGAKQHDGEVDRLVGGDPISVGIHRRELQEAIGMGR